MPPEGDRRRFVFTFFVILSLISTLSFFGLRYAGETAKDRVIEALQEGEKRAAEAMAGRIEEILYNIAADLLLVRRTIERHLIGEIERQTLSNLLIDFINSHNAYDHVRFLDMQGLEVIRVNNSSNGVVLADRSVFPDKTAAGLILAAQDLPRNGFFVTAIDANKDRGVIQYPLKPVVSVMVPVLTPDGTKTGVVILNYEARHLLDALLTIGAAAVGTPVTINAAGRSALEDFHTDDARDFEAPGNKRVLFPEKYPEAWSVMSVNPEGVIRNDKIGMLTYVSFSASQMTTSARFRSDIAWFTAGGKDSQTPAAWILGTRVDTATLNSMASISQNRSWTTELGFAVVIGLLSWLIALQMAGLRSRAGEMRELAIHDHLTGLMNRREFEQRFNSAMAHSKRHERQMALLYIDLNNFKTINDTLGHSTGDLVLQKIAKALTRGVRQSDIVGRLGGDEFAVALSEMRTAADAQTVLEYLKEQISDTLEVNGHRIEISASVGVATYPADGQDFESLSEHADAAMYRDKTHSAA